MTPYELINNLDDIAIQAGTFTTILLPCYYSDGEEIILSEMTGYGCTLSVLGDDTTLETIMGTVESGSTNIMKIEITSAMTASMSSCLLLYRPFIIDGTKVYRFQGRIYIGSSSLYVLPS